jgi:hypothetical protein
MTNKRGMKKGLYNTLSALFFIFPPLAVMIYSVVDFNPLPSYNYEIECRQVLSITNIDNTLGKDHFVIVEGTREKPTLIKTIRPIKFSSNLEFTINKKYSVLHFEVEAQNLIKVESNVIAYLGIFENKNNYRIEDIKVNQENTSKIIAFSFGSLITFLLGGVIIAQVILKKMNWYKDHPRITVFLSLLLGTLILALVNAIISDLLLIFIAGLVSWSMYCGLYIYDTSVLPKQQAKKLAKQVLPQEEQIIEQQEIKVEVSEDKGE